MAWTKGTLTVDPQTGAASGGGALLQSFNLMWAAFTSYITTVATTNAHFYTQPGGQFYVSQRQFVLLMANMVVEAMHYAVQNEIKAVVDTSDSGLQRTPNPNNANTDTQGPSAKKTLDLE